MTPPSIWAVGSALAVVLGVLALATWALRRFGGGLASPLKGREIEVVSRVGLAPRQGVALLEVQGRRFLVTYGEGGVRRLSDLGDSPTSEVETSESMDEVSPPAPRRGLSFAAALNRARVVGGRALILTVTALALGGAATRTAAQVADSATAADVRTSGGQEDAAEEPAAVAAADAVASIVRSPPQVAVSLGSGGAGGEGLQLSGPVATVVFMGFLTLIPTLLLLTTGFARILIVLHLLKQALGTQTAPPAHLLTAMALLLTGFVMAPTFERMHESAIEPWMDGQLDEMQMLKTAQVPLREFMLSSTREQDLSTFVALHAGPAPRTASDVPFVVLTSAFVTSELTRAFQMGFALFLPFVVIDIVVASVLMSMGMFMLPPVMVSLPFKLLLFVLVDGWALVMGSIVQSF